MGSGERAIGIDVGGTKMAIGAVDGAGAIHARETVPTDPKTGFAPALARLQDAIDRVLADAGWTAGEIAGLGLGCPGPVDPETGHIENWYTLPGWEGADIVTPLRARYDKPVQMMNDADVALLGEARAGAARGARVAVMLTIGTGVGGAALIDGRIHRGVGGAHPEIGHMPIDPDGPECYCGTRGCLESIAAGPAITRAGKTLGLADSRAVFAAAEAGDGAAGALIAAVARATETAAWALLHAFAPDVILFGGGIGARHFGTFETAATRALARATLIKGTRVLKASLGNDAGMVGAAALMMPRPA